MIKFYKHILVGFARGFSSYFRYQLFTKFIFAILVMPLFLVATNKLIQSTSNGVISNNMLIDFLLSPKGLIYLGLALLLLIIGILFELCGFIILSANFEFETDKRLRDFKSLFQQILSYFPRFFEYGILVILLYLIFLTPFTGIGLKLSFLENFQIPEFVNQAISQSTLLSILEWVLFFLLCIPGLLMTFTFHFIVLGHKPPSQAIRSSFQLIVRHWRHFIKDVILVLLFVTCFFILSEWLWSNFINVILNQLDSTQIVHRSLVVFLVLLQHIGVLFMTMMFIPFEVYHFTVMFYELTEKDERFKYLTSTYPKLAIKSKPSWIDKIFQKRLLLISFSVVLLILISIPFGVFFNEIFRADYPIDIFAHRAGGVNILENTLESAKSSIENGADWIEIDVQRTIDGEYVLFHDASMKRLSGKSLYIENSTYQEILSLQSNIVTLEKMIQTYKDRVKFNIEIKGTHTDETALEVLRLVNRYQIEQSVLVTSQDYELIQNIELKQPSIQTGLIYFLALGNVATLNCDYLILEIGEANENTIRSIHDANKKAIVWTINDEDDLWDYIRMEVDGIITDDVPLLKSLIEERDNESDDDLLFNLFFY